MDNTLRYEDGSLTACKPPSWFSNLNDAKNWEDGFASSTIHIDEIQGGGESLNLYRMRESRNQWVVALYDPAEVVAYIFIDGAANYILFRANIYAPLVNQMASNEQLTQLSDPSRSQFRRQYC